MGQLPKPSRSKSQFIYDFSVYEYSSKSDAERMVEKIRTVLDDARTNEQFKEIQLELLWRDLKRSNKSKTASTKLVSEQKKTKKKTRKEKNRERKERLESIVKKASKSVPTSVAKSGSVSPSPQRVHKMALQPASKKQVTPWPTWAQVKANKVVAVPKEAVPVETAIHEPELEAVALTNVLIQSTVQNPKLEVEVKASSSFEISEKTKVEPVVSSAATPKLETFRWPSTVAYEADESMPESNWPKVGMLSAVGYCVGIYGLGLKQRQELLSNVYSKRLPFVDSRKYVAEWGGPKSSERLKKLAEAIAAFVRNAKRKKNNMSVAIREWEQDLAWLKEKYYLQHKFIWVWPKSVLPSKEKENCQQLVAPKTEKTYRSSREFLVEQYTNDANELCCQICQSALPFKLENGEYFWEETPVLESVESSAFSDLVLCPNHRAMYVHANATPNQLLDSLGGNFTKSISINLAGENSLIFVSEKHQQKLRILAESYLAKEPVSPTIDFDISQVPKGLQGTKRLYLYEKEGQWVVSSRANTIHSLASKEAALQWIECFDSYRGMSSKVTEQVPTAKPKKVNKLKLNGRSTPSVAAMRFGTVKKAEPKSSFKSGYSLCTTCNGDGGINGGCWKCGGSGWM